jgi:hypothetical protein
MKISRSKKVFYTTSLALLASVAPALAISCSTPKTTTTTNVLSSYRANFLKLPSLTFSKGLSYVNGYNLVNTFNSQIAGEKDLVKAFNSFVDLFNLRLADYKSDFSLDNPSSKIAIEKEFDQLLLIDDSITIPRFKIMEVGKPTNFIFIPSVVIRLNEATETEIVQLYSELITNFNFASRNVAQVNFFESMKFIKDFNDSIITSSYEPYDSLKNIIEIMNEFFPGLNLPEPLEGMKVNSSSSD